MFARFCRWTIVPSLCVAGMACSKIPTAGQVYSNRMDESLASPRPYLTYMADNAMLHDMTIADLHFIPHTNELNGTGAARLDRLAVLLDVYGGVVRYETYSTDDEFVEQRLAHVRDYLATTGCDMSRVDVEAMISGGRGLPAEQAVKIMEAGTKKPSESAAGAPLLIGQPSS